MVYDGVGDDREERTGSGVSTRDPRPPGTSAINERAAAAAVVGYDRVVRTAAAAAAYLLSAAVVAQQSHVAACLSVVPCQSDVSLSLGS